MSKNGMKFFSGKGDDGKSSLLEGDRISKSDPVFELIGTLDELSANLGMAISLCKDQPDVRGDLQKIQQILSGSMGFIAGGRKSASDFHEDTRWIESRIDFYSENHENPSGFVMPGKTALGASLDIARTVTRRAERVAVRYSAENEHFDAGLLALLNRLSSLFFVLRLYIDHLNNPSFYCKNLQNSI
jgi:cob(I)alamin adenosyltransferase